MLDQSLLTLLATILGGILATVGGIAANYYTQVFNNRAERQKFIREKCEEAYLLADQVKLWAKNENHRWWQKYYEEFEPDSDELEMYRKELEPIDCPINKLMMIITLQLPELRTKAEALKRAVEAYQEFSDGYREYGWHSFQANIESVLRTECRRLEESHQELHLLIEKTVLKSWGIRANKTRTWKKVLAIKKLIQGTQLHTRSQIEDDEYTFGEDTPLQSL